MVNKKKLFNIELFRYEIKSKGGKVLAWITAECTDDELMHWLKNTVFTFNPNLC